MGREVLCRANCMIVIRDERNFEREKGIER